ALVDVDPHRRLRLARPEVALEGAERDHVQVVEPDVAELPVTDVPGEDALAVALARRLREGARARDRAFADVEPVALEVPLGRLRSKGRTTERETMGVPRSRRRVLAGVVFAVVTIVVGVLFAKHLTGTSWPLQRAHMGLVAAAGSLYFASYVLRALGWQKLFPAGARPG